MGTSANALPRPWSTCFGPSSLHPLPHVPPLPTLAGPSCSISEAHCGLMGFTFLASYQGKSWKCASLEILFLASRSPLMNRVICQGGSVILVSHGPGGKASSRQHLGISAAMRVGQPPGKLAGKSPGCLGGIQNFSTKVPLPLPMPTLLKSPQGPGPRLRKFILKAWNTFSKWN